MHRTITFRLKSSSYVGTVEMENSVMACREVQEAIAAKLCAPVEEIQVFLANSTALLHPEETIAMFSVVDVVRQVSLGKPSNPKSASVTAVSTASALGSAATMSGLDANTSLTEEERLAQLKAEISLDTGMNEVGRGGGGGGRGGRGRGRGGANGMPFMMNADSFKPPPKGYVCHNCGKGGHKIEHCPASRNGRNLKALSFAIGIPESMLEECSMDDPASKFITKDYRIVKRRMDPSAFTGVLPATAEAETPANAEEGCGDGANADDDLELEPFQCILDGVVAKEAMKVPCCGRLLCRSCYDSIVQKALTRDHDDESDDEELGLCPSCKEPLCFEDVVDAVEERDKITALLSNRKRKRS